MTSKTPVRVVFDGSNNATGLAEFQSGEFVPLTHGGTGASLSIGTAGQVLKVNSGATALEFGSVEAVFNIDGMTDGTGITVVDGDLLAISDGGTEKRITASQLKSYIGGYDGDITTIDIDGGTDIGAALADADLFIVDDGAGGTNRKLAASRIKTYVSDITLTTAAQTAITSVGTLTGLTIADGGNIGSASDTDALTIDATGNVTASQNLTVTGDLTVNGSTTTVNSTNTTIDDNLLELNSGASSNANDSGIIIERGSTGDNAVVMWDESADQFVVGTTTATASSTGNISHTKADFEAAQITGSSGVFTSTGVTAVMTVTGTDDGSGEGPDIVIKRNSASPADDDILGALVLKGENDADQAVTYAKIRARATDVSDGTEDGKLEFFTISNGSIENVASLDNTTLFLNTGLTLTFEGATANAHETTLTVTDPTADRTITLPDATGTVALTSSDITGNAATATTLETARTIGGVSFNGSANIDLPGVNTAGNQNTSGSAATLTTARTIGGVSFDGSANIDLPGVNTTGNQNTTGSAATLTTARTIGGVSFDGSANINLPGVNTTGNQNTTGSAATLTTARTIAGKSFDGSANITIGLTDIGISDGSADQVLTTDGAGNFTFQDSQGGSGFSASTITVLPSSEGNFDLTKTNNAGASETPFDSAATDAFGVAVGALFDCMEPTGSGGTTTDLGAFT